MHNLHEDPHCVCVLKNSRVCVSGFLLWFEDSEHDVRFRVTMEIKENVSNS